jgi:hypothetical protein
LNSLTLSGSNTLLRLLFSSITPTPSVYQLRSPMVAADSFLMPLFSTPGDELVVFQVKYARNPDLHGGEHHPLLPAEAVAGQEHRRIRHRRIRALHQETWMIFWTTDSPQSIK